MERFRIYLYAVIFVIYVSALYAEEKKAENKLRMDEIQITCQKGSKINMKAGTAEFHGDVKVKLFSEKKEEKGFSITCDEFRVEFNKNSNEIIKAAASGSVSITAGEKRAEAKMALYEGDKGLITLSGEPYPYIVEGDNHITAPVITYLVNEEVFEFPSGIINSEIKK